MRASLSAAFAACAVSLWCGCKSEAGSARGPVPAGAQGMALAGAIAFEPAFGTDKGNAFRFPVWFGEIPGKPGAYLVLERGDGSEDAHVWALTRAGEGYARSVFLTVPVETSASPGDERGLLGLAFHPGFARNRKYYLNYIPKRRPGQTHDSTVIEERNADVTMVRDAGGPGRRILAFEQPYANHNGGTLAFGPDGFLYIGTGDGGSGGDPHGHGQSLETLLAKMLRIDVDDSARGRAYGIPKDNPFAGRAGARPEIWAYGLRNPWKWSFDALTGDLWVGDVGQDRHEEIDRVRRGGNLGWNRMEGFACYDPPLGCDREGLAPPEAAFDRRDAACIIGGYVYRGDTASAFYGAYLFGDYMTRNFFALPPRHRPGEPALKLGALPDQPSAFGADARGGLYLVGYSRGVIYRLAMPASEKP